MKKYIEATKENKEFVAKCFDVSERLVRYAMEYDERRGMTDLAKKIRKLLIARGAQVMTALPEVETFHDADGMIRQNLPNGARIEFSKSNNMGDVFFDGKHVKHYDSVALSDITNIQNWAMSLTR